MCLCGVLYIKNIMATNQCHYSRLKVIYLIRQDLTFTNYMKSRKMKNIFANSGVDTLFTTSAMSACGCKTRIMIIIVNIMSWCNTYLHKKKEKIWCIFRFINQKLQQNQHDHNIRLIYSRRRVCSWNEIRLHP